MITIIIRYESGKEFERAKIYQIDLMKQGYHSIIRSKAKLE